jgi:hypothetical protein
VSTWATVRSVGSFSWSKAAYNAYVKAFAPRQERHNIQHYVERGLLEGDPGPVLEVDRRRLLPVRELAIDGPGELGPPG